MRRRVNPPPPQTKLLYRRSLKIYQSVDMVAVIIINTSPSIETAETLPDMQPLHLENGHLDQARETFDAKELDTKPESLTPPAAGISVQVPSSNDGIH